MGMRLGQTRTRVITLPKAASYAEPIRSGNKVRVPPTNDTTDDMESLGHSQRLLNEHLNLKFNCAQRFSSSQP